MINVRRPALANDAARFTVVVVFPTPPFWFMRAMVRVGRIVGLVMRNPEGMFVAKAAVASIRQSG
jgi:hypothetical protein